MFILPPRQQPRGSFNQHFYRDEKENESDIPRPDSPHEPGKQHYPLLPKIQEPITQLTFLCNFSKAYWNIKIGFHTIYKAF